MLFRLALTLILPWIGPALLLAQEAAPEAEATEAAAGGPTTVEQQAFDEVFAEWQQLMVEMRQLGKRFQTATSVDQSAMQTDFQALMDQSHGVAPRLVAAGENAYRAAPNENKEVADFLVMVLSDHIRSDRYPQALALAEMLIDNGAADKNCHLFGGFAAFVLGDNDRALEYFQVAGEAKLIINPPETDTSSLASMMRYVIRFLNDPEGYREAWAAEQEIRTAEAEADDLPRVRMETSKGEILIELFENEAPNTVANFISLVEKGFYDGLTFHRVLPLFMVQGGCPKGDGSGSPGYSVACECYEPNARGHFRGSLSMAHAGRDTGGSQFFMTSIPTSVLDGRHTVFGRVIEGIEVLEELKRINPERPVPGREPDTIVAATVDRKRDHAYEPETLPDIR